MKTESREWRFWRRRRRNDQTLILCYLEDGATINTDTENVGDAGDITIEVDESVVLEGEGLGSFTDSTDIFASQITTTAELILWAMLDKISISANKLAIVDECWIYKLLPTC